MNAEARKSNSPNHFYPLGLWSTPGRQTVYFTAEPDGSSLYLPNEKLVNRWRYSTGKNLGEMLTVKRRIPINVTSIDQWRKDENIPPLDFIKLNVQAAELEILHGAESSLACIYGLPLRCKRRLRFWI
jgi:FkbM family methyltransferase